MYKIIPPKRTSRLLTGFIIIFNAQKDIQGYFVLFSRYLTWLEVFLTNLELTHPGATELMDRGVLGVARSLIPGSLSDVDRTMEETFMKFAKGSGRHIRYGPVI